MCDDIKNDYQNCIVCKNRKQNLAAFKFYPDDDDKVVVYKNLDCRKFEFDKNEYTKLHNDINDEIKHINSKTFEKKDFFDDSNRIEYEEVEISLKYLYRNIESIPLEYEIKRDTVGVILNYVFFFGIAIMILYLSIFKNHERAIIWYVVGICLASLLVSILITREKNLLKSVKVNTNGISFYGKENKSINWKDILAINILMVHVASKGGTSIHRTIIVHLFNIERLEFPAIDLLNFGPKAKELLFWARFYQDCYWKKQAE